MACKKTHKDVEFAVDGHDGRERIYKKFGEALEAAFSKAVSRGEKVDKVEVWVESPGTIEEKLRKMHDEYEGG